MKNHRLAAVTAVLILGILICYLHEMSPSALMGLLRAEFGLEGNDMLMNLRVSIVFPMIILGSLWGSALERRLGTYHLFTLAMAFATVGLLGNLLAGSYPVFLVLRAVYALGFGLSIPFIGSAIMKWYPPARRDAMTTVDGMFPFLSTLLSFAVLVPLSNLFHGSWRMALAVWGVITLILLVLWLTALKEPVHQPSPRSSEASPGTGSALSDLLRRRPIRMLSIIFVCDFFCYSYLATILPTFLYEISDLSESTANLLAAVAFPLLGLLGCLCGGALMARLPRRRPILAAGQLLKIAGMLLAVLAAGHSLPVTVAGVGLFGFGNGLWMPVMFRIPTELPGMDSGRVAAAFSMMMSIGYVSGFIAPLLGGALCDLLAVRSGLAGTAAHVAGLKQSLLLFSVFNLAALLCALRTPETGGGVSRG